ncbi:MAG: Multidrug resistance protein MdtK [Bacteroidetes bacterium ADurb.Bin408]|nr:MAG: Multidrug resistance protein MdtK [Bacteroidetes bacterium ADurb.Bin408]
MYYFTYILFGAGLGTGTQIVIGRRNGENDIHGIRDVFSNSLYISLGLSLVLFFVLFNYSVFFFNHIISSSDIRESACVFIKYRQWGILFAYTSIILRSFFIGILRTRVLLYSTLFMSAVNVFLDYALIFGKFGFPALGVGGAALASVIAEISDLLFLTVWIFSSKRVAIYKIFHFKKADFKLFVQLIKISGPVMLQYTFSFGGWFIFFLIIEKMGQAELAVSNIARSIYMVIMIPVWGLSNSTGSMVSNLIGNGRTYDVLRLIRKIIAISVSATIIIILCYIFIPYDLVSLYTPNEDLIKATVPVLYVITVAIIFFSFSHIIFSAISGTGNTLYALAIETATIVLYIGGAYVMGIILNKELPVVWLVEVLYFIIIGMLSALYFWKFNWKNIKV